jgi:polysaccharide biosynthesis/export protein
MIKVVVRAARLAVLILLMYVPALAAQQRGASLPPGQSRADVISRLRSMMETTGMTTEQIRSRLRSQGYSESLLDPFMPGTRGADSTAIPDEDVFAAVRSLGLVDSLAVDSMRSSTRLDRRRLQARDSAFVDSVVAAIRQDTTEATREAMRLLLRTSTADRSVADSGFALFGRSLFDRETSEFDPNLSATVGPDYALGPGDQLVLVITGDTEKAHRLEVTRQGFVVIPEVGQVSVSNLTLGQFEDQLYTLLRRVYSGVSRGPDATTRFSINVARSGSNQIHVTGDVARPGAYQVSRAGSVVSALYLAGGPTERGSMRRVQIRRAGTLVGNLDLYDYALQGTATAIALRSGDIVFVPPRGPQVRITGAVLRPATYEMKPGETLADLIRMAGGFRPEADRRFVQIDRIVPAAERTSIGASRRLVHVGSELLQTGDGPPEALNAGDVVHVLSVPRRFSGRVAVLGNVWQPGPVAFTPGMQLSTALRRAGGLKPDSYLGEVVVSRLLPDSSRQMIRASLRDTSGAAEVDVALTDADEITVFSLTEMRPQTYITISGAVREPGRIPYRQGMTLRQAILLAGGLQESALLTEAEIARASRSIRRTSSRARTAARTSARPAFPRRRLAHPTSCSSPTTPSWSSSSRTGNCRRSSRSAARSGIRASTPSARGASVFRTSWRAPADSRRTATPTVSCSSASATVSDASA